MANTSGTSHVYVGTAARIPGALGGFFGKPSGAISGAL